MVATDHYDVIVIGSGPGGGSLAQRLAPTGKRILMLERGGYLPRSRDNWDAKTVFVDGRYQAPDTWYGKNGESFHPGLHYYVGGNSKVYGSALFTSTAFHAPVLSATTCSSRTSAKPRRCSTSMANAARIRMNPGPASPTPFRRCCTSRASRR